MTRTVGEAVSGSYRGEAFGGGNGQEIANIAWAFAKSGYFDPGILMNLAEMAEKQMDRFNSQEITNGFGLPLSAECLQRKIVQGVSKSYRWSIARF